MRYFVLLSALLSVGFVQASQVCFPEISASTQSDDFIALPGGQVHQQSKGLIWQRCLYGQSWNHAEQRCDGAAIRLTWQEALQQSTTLSVPAAVWRVPDVKEAMSIVERQCVDPAIRLSVFPNTNSENIWTSTTVQAMPVEAWAIAMYSGKNNRKGKEQQLYVRFVRLSDE
ncbi:DUF1566 domain-containing protein [Alkalimonas amylolytica]|uniref:Lcl C-terminal domain-containing protein n=1 Tax=Alkalimonas amylolytica TaxID=152573 RepID=A0A1H4EYX6_ALKAM|nr:DUF1566 domain-containing protein [Alkalimonas amylolytica]SEA90181.1 Protein of unknown function [Alkalimonas amylolytica]